MKIRLLIADDEPLARQRLRTLLAAEPDLQIVAEAADGPATVLAVREHTPDVLLLDVQMPGLDGFDVLRELGAVSLPVVIFVTAYEEHAVRAFEARALDYLLKPTKRARFRQAIERARAEVLARRSGGGLPQPLLDLLAEREAAAPRPRRIAVRSGERILFVPAEEIDWIEAAGNYAILHVGRATHILRETMSGFEAQLPADLFFRVSRSAIVNLRRIRELQAVAPGEHVAILTDGQRLAVTRSVREVEEKMRFI